MPLTVGGGVREVDDFALLLERGADKVCINALAFEKPELVSEAAARFGAQCVVVSIDFRTDAVGRAFVHTCHAGVPEARGCRGIGGAGRRSGRGRNPADGRGS